MVEVNESVTSLSLSIGWSCGPTSSAPPPVGVTAQLDAEVWLIRWPPRRTLRRGTPSLPPPGGALPGPDRPRCRSDTSSPPPWLAVGLSETSCRSEGILPPRARRSSTKAVVAPPFSTSHFHLRFPVKIDEKIDDHGLAIHALPGHLSLLLGSNLTISHPRRWSAPSAWLSGKVRTTMSATD